MGTPREDFAKVFTKHQSWLYAFLVTLLGNVSDADEVFQEVCVTLWSELDAFDLSTDFRKWAGAIARNRVLNFRTKQYREAKRLSDVAVELVAQEMHDRADLLDDRRQALRGCLDRLQAADRTLVELCYSDASRTFQAAAENLGRSVNTVYKQLQRIRRLLRECVDRKITART